MMIEVATHSATAASNWFAIPNSGHSELIPPSGSRTPCQRKYPQSATMRPLVANTDGYQLVRPSGFHAWPSASCSMKRPTRVPASSTVRMNSASNMSAKWYHNAITACPPRLLEKMCAMPTANAGAPPVRLNNVCSPTLCASACMDAAVTGNPQLVIMLEAFSGSWPAIPAGLLIAKYVPGSTTHAATVAMIATSDSATIAPYPTMRASVSQRINFGVVPLEINEWNPLIAPHAIVMNANGNSLPANTGPVPSVNRVSAGMCSVGCITNIPMASKPMVPSFTNVLR